MKRLAWILLAFVAAACGDADIGSTFPDSFPTTTTRTIPRDEFFVPSPTTVPAVPATTPAAPSPPRTTPPGDHPPDEILTASPAGLLRIGAELQAEFIAVGEEQDGGRLEVVASFGAGGGVVVPIGDDGEPTGEIVVIVDDEVAYTAEGAAFTEGEDGVLETAGELRRVSDAEDVAFQLRLGRGAGSTVVALDGNRAVLSGEIGSGTLAQLLHVIRWHPEVDTLVLAGVPGSVDDEAMQAAGRLVREFGLRTEVPEDGFVASGGVDLFAAGVERTIGEGATLAVHAWEDPAAGVAADGIPPGDARHRPYLDYLSQMLGEVTGPDFYFFTIGAAGPDDLHVLSDEEIARYGLVTR